MLQMKRKNILVSMIHVDALPHIDKGRRESGRPYE
jgi:hypothetical protein